MFPPTINAINDPHRLQKLISLMKESYLGSTQEKLLFFADIN